MVVPNPIIPVSVNASTFARKEVMESDKSNSN
jgi:hypothetical protein